MNVPKKKFERVAKGEGNNEGDRNRRRRSLKSLATLERAFPAHLRFCTKSFYRQQQSLSLSLSSSHFVAIDSI